MSTPAHHQRAELGPRPQDHGSTPRKPLDDRRAALAATAAAITAAVAAAGTNAPTAAVAAAVAIAAAASTYAASAAFTACTAVVVAEAPRDVDEALGLPREAQHDVRCARPVGEDLNGAGA